MCGGAWLKLGPTVSRRRASSRTSLSRATNEVGARRSRHGRQRIAACAGRGALPSARPRGLRALPAPAAAESASVTRRARAESTARDAWHDSPRTRTIRRSTPGPTAAAGDHGRAQGACRSSPRHSGPIWILLADAWMAAAAEARRRKDGAGIEDAMFHVATPSASTSGRRARADPESRPTDDETLPALSGCWRRHRHRGCACALARRSSTAATRTGRREPARDLRTVAAVMPIARPRLPRDRRRRARQAPRLARRAPGRARRSWTPGRLRRTASRQQSRIR